VWLGSRDKQRGLEAVASLADAGDVRLLVIDVTSDDSVDAAVATVEAGGGVDVLVNNAGMLGAQPASETTAADLLGCFGVNLLGPVRVMHGFLPLLQRSEHPRVVMVSSGHGVVRFHDRRVAAEHGFVGLVYPSSKSALNMVTTM